LPRWLRTIPSSRAALDAFDPIKVVTACGGLLTVPQFQSSCLRLEALAHLALFACNDNKKLQPKHLKLWFADLGKKDNAACSKIQPKRCQFSTPINSASDRNHFARFARSITSRID
jgi:hypothetical protein